MFASAPFFFLSCAIEKAVDEKLFRLVEADSSGLHFTNQIQETAKANILTYQYFYNGGGVAVGDVNNDGLEDLYLTSNQGSNKLFLNLGNMKFRDITLATVTGGRENAWATGAVMVDINSDGFQDIYVCYSGDLPADQRRNQLFVNQGLDAKGIPFYKEMSAEFGLDDPAFSTSAYFADLDLDGDLDMLLLNHNPSLYNNLNANAFKTLLQTNDTLSSSKVYRNENGVFRDVSSEIGIDAGTLSYGLGAIIGDFNEDGWPDIYIGNDYSAPDYFYVNQGDGNFVNQLQSAFTHTSLYSMGVDAADINRDGKLDLISLDMLPEDNKRQKLLHSPENYEHYNLFLEVGLHHQLMRNMLQLNNGNGTFSEVGQAAGISTTDWSWTPLFADFDNDGFTDLFVSNGFLKDFTNLDFINYRQQVLQKSTPNQQQVMELINGMPATKVGNYAFQNLNGVNFKNTSKYWGLDSPGNSNGAVYADLDQDGDLDLIVNNLNEPAQIYENLASDRKTGNFLQIKLIGSPSNSNGIGAKIRVFQGNTTHYQQQQLYKGFQGNVTSILHFGLENPTIDSLRIDWPSGESQTIISPTANRKIELNLVDAWALPVLKTEQKGRFEFSSEVQFAGLTANFNDFKRQSQLLYSLSQAEPILASGDLDGDGLPELISSSFEDYLMVIDGANHSIETPKRIPIQNSGISSILVLDLDGDGDLDIFLGKGGYGDFTESDSRLQDQALLNDGKGGFEQAPAGFLPKNLTSSAVSIAWDYDGDGQNEIFIGGGYVPGRWPESHGSYLLKRTGNQYQISNDPLLTALKRVKEAVTVDLDGDGLEELVVAGEFDRLRVFSYKNGKLEEVSDSYFPAGKTGMWRTLLIEDLNGDGNPELLAGNWGLNSRLKTTPEVPLRIYFADFDENGSVDPIVTFPIQAKEYPLLSRDELASQMYRKKALFSDYERFSTVGISTILTEEELSKAEILFAETLETQLFTLKNGKFDQVDIPFAVQFSPVNSVLSIDGNGGKRSLLLFGNLDNPRLKIGKIAGNQGLMLEMEEGTEKWKAVNQTDSGFSISNEVTQAIKVGKSIWIGNRNEGLKFFVSNK
jgi:hypothetical protein